ncbi:MAG: transcription termination factor Rho, partial [Lachnospiraceae bacterium]|nr:transcription termination factor Rho [Lachnospiraceae bacterium]
MREKLETLPLAQLRQIAKDLEIKSISGKKKAELIESIIEENKAREAASSREGE